MTWLVDSRGIANKVKNATSPSVCQPKDYGSKMECPNCHHQIDNSDMRSCMVGQVSTEWPGLPAGVKFDPSDVELLEHLAAKCGLENSKPHMFIDEFIPTLEGGDGICYTHPENLPGAKKDGNNVHFFHKTTNAYSTGQRKRRKIHDQYSVTMGQFRWHKTGKTKVVMENGVQRGWKKIMVLYSTLTKGSKADKSNWIMHQYHIGYDEDEKNSQYVVSKVFYQQQNHTNKNDNFSLTEVSDMGMIRTSPRTPNTNVPNPPRPKRSISVDDYTDDYKSGSHGQEADFIEEASHVEFKDDIKHPSYLAGESQELDVNGIDYSLLCNENSNSYAPLDDSELNHGTLSGFIHSTNNVGENRDTHFAIPNLKDIELDSPPDFQIEDLQFNSQDSVFGWIDRFSQ